MTGVVKHAKLETKTSRRRLPHKKEPHWRALTNRAHLGWQRKPDVREAGKWILRTYRDSKYSVRTLGWADDLKEADGELVFSFEQAQAMAKAMADGQDPLPGRLTVARAMANYIEHQRNRGKPVEDLVSRTEAWIIPNLGNVLVQELSTQKLQRWLAAMAASPAMKRSAQNGKQQFKSAPSSIEDHRRRRSSANRVLTMLKAALNLAFKHKRVASDLAWRHVEPFHAVDVSRKCYLTIKEATRLINSCNREFRPLVEAALHTGARYGELIRLEIADYNPDSGTIHVRRSKTGAGRHVHLTTEGTQFFAEVCAGRAGSASMFQRNDGSPWNPSQQARPMTEAVLRAKIDPAITFHALRHSWASLSVMAGVPLLVVARNMGHSTTRMVEKHYGHLAPSFIADAIRAGAPQYGAKRDRKVVPLG